MTENGVCCKWMEYILTFDYPVTRAETFKGGKWYGNALLMYCNKLTSTGALSSKWDNRGSILMRFCPHCGAEQKLVPVIECVISTEAAQSP